jgi:two-component system, NarL family, response regulator NreC
MCIDDHPLLVDALERRLSQEPDFGTMFRVQDYAHVVAEAVAHHPSLILLDHTLPGGLEGFVVLEELVRTLPESRVIIFTGDATRELAAVALSRGAWGVVSKGVMPERLLRALRDVLGGEAVVALDP